MEDIRRLKVRLFAEGLDIADKAKQALTRRGDHPMTLAEYATTSGVILRIPGDIYVNAPVFEDFATDAEITLTHGEDGFALVDAGSSWPVEPVPLPRYVFQEAEDGTQYRNLGIVHTDRVRVSPIGGCAYRCKFCDLPYTVDYTKKRIQNLIEVVEAARRDKVLPAHHVTISGGTPKKQDEAFLDAAVTTLARETQLPVDVMMCPRPEPGYLREYRRAGVGGLFLNMELYGQKASEEIMPQKAKLMKPHFLDSIEQAVEIFGEPNVHSLVILGLEPLDDTLAAVEALVERGCVPVLSPFRPSPHTPLGDQPPPDAETMVEAYRRTLELCESYGLMPGPPCVPCHHNTLTFPEGDGFYERMGPVHDEASIA